MIYYLDLIAGESSKDFSSSGVLYNSKGEVVKRIFDDGKSLPELKAEKFTIIIDEEDSNTKGQVKDKIPSFVQDAGAVFILSKKGCDFLKDAGIKNFEFYDLTIKGKDVNIQTHKLVKVLGPKIDCIDKDNSEIEYLDNGNIDSIDYLEIDESKIPENLSLFLLGGIKAAEVFAKEELVDNLKQNLSGFKFIPREEFTIA